MCPSCARTVRTTRTELGVDVEDVTGPIGPVTPGRRRERRPWILSTLALVVVGVLAAAGLAVLGGGEASADASTGMLRLAHLSPTTPAVDMYVSGRDLPQTLVAGGVSYQQVSPYLVEPAGTYRFQARPAGASAQSTPAIDVTLEIPGGSAQTAAFVDVGANQQVAAQVLDDETAPAPAGSGRVRVVAAAAGLGPLEVDAVGGPPLARGVFYGSSTPYVAIPARPWTFRVTSRAGTTESATLPVGDRAVGSLVVTRGSDGDLALALVPDAASVPAPIPPTAPTTVPPPAPAAPSAPRPPEGGVGAGAGGLASVDLIDEIGSWFSDDPDVPAAPFAARWPETAALDAGPTDGGPRPTGLVAPTAGIVAPSTVDLRIDYRGRLQVPTDYGRVGWYVDSAVPGDPGPAVMVGHVDTRRGPAVFAGVDRLRPGDVVDVPRSDGRTAHFAVDEVSYYPKDAVPTERVYGPTAAPSLRLVTCGGAFDRTTLSYEDNVVVFASFRGTT